MTDGFIRWCRMNDTLTRQQAAADQVRDRKKPRWFRYV